MPPKAKATFSTDWKSNKATPAAVAKFEEQFTKTMGMDLRRGDETSYEVIPTGVLALDSALAVGGFPTGRIVEVWGPQDAGKSSLAILACVEAQNMFPNKMIAWVDMEQTFDSKWAKSLGLDLSRVWRPPVKTAEDAADQTKKFAMSGLCSMIVLDSIGGMIAKMEIEKDAEEATIGLVAKIVTRMVKQCSSICNYNDTTVVVVNQVRAQIGGYGPSETTTGGWALRHVTTMKMQVKRGEPHKVKIDGDDVSVGYEMSIRVQRNKLAPDGVVAKAWFHNRATAKYGPVGVDTIAEAAALGIKYKVISMRAGGYYTMLDDVEVRGKDSVEAYLREHPKQVTEMRKKLLSRLAVEVEVDDDPLGMAEMADES